MNIQLFDYTVDILSALLWEYNEAISLQKLLQSKQDWYDNNQTAFWEAWFNNVFNLQTATEFGLAVWCIILDLPLQIGNTDFDKPIWGFDNLRHIFGSYVNFDRGTFLGSSEQFNLTLEEQRIILKLRYYQLTNRCAIPEANAFLKFVFTETDNAVYLLDGLNMSIRLIINDNLGPRLLSVILEFDLIPRATGVLLEYIPHLANAFGFDNPTGGFSAYENFDRGTFLEVLTND